MCCKICFRTKICYKTLCETSHWRIRLNMTPLFVLAIFVTVAYATPSKYQLSILRNKFWQLFSNSNYFASSSWRRLSVYYDGPNGSFFYFDTNSQFRIPNSELRILNSEFRIPNFAFRKKMLCIENLFFEMPHQGFCTGWGLLI